MPGLRDQRIAQLQSLLQKRDERIGQLVAEKSAPLPNSPTNELVAIINKLVALCVEQKAVIHRLEFLQKFRPL